MSLPAEGKIVRLMTVMAMAVIVLVVAVTVVIMKKTTMVVKVMETSATFYESLPP